MLPTVRSLSIAGSLGRAGPESRKWPPGLRGRAWPFARLRRDTLCAGSHAVYVWTQTGHHSQTGNPLKVHGWEEWDLGDDLKVKASRGWFDAEEYARQAGTG